MIRVEILGVFFIASLAGCASIPAPTADRAQNPAHATAAESPRPAFTATSRPEPATPASGASADAGDGEHAAHSMASATEAESASSMAYACPMHPEEQSEEPGSCSQCGMALVSTTEPKRKP